MSEGLPPKGGIELIERLRVEGIDSAPFILVLDLDRAKLYQLARARVLGVAHRQLDLAHLVDMLVDVGQGRMRIDERTTQTWMEDYAVLVEENAELRRRLVRYEAPFADLSDREVDVLRCLAAGLHNPEIADRLFITVHTVSKHVGEILKKLQVGTRQEAANIAHKHGLC
jgi:DNA-binding NarL/FixJ family response regulator